MSEQDFREEIESEAGEVVETVETTVEDQAIIDRARRMGWRPEAEYRGPPGKWVDAKTFVDRGETELPIMRERFRKLDDRLMNTEAKLTTTVEKLSEADQRLKETVDVLQELRVMSRTAEERGYKKAMQELQERQVAAVRNADEAEFRRVEFERQQLEASRPQFTASNPGGGGSGAPGTATSVPVTPPPVTTAPPAPAPDPAVTRWIHDNPWYTSDKTLHDYAINMDIEVQQENPTWPMEDKLAEVKQRVMDRFPEKFTAPRRPAAVAAPSSNVAPRPKGHQFKDLPKEARDAFAKFKKQMPDYTEAEYMKTYYGEE